MKKITMSKDGIPRFNLKLETRIGARDMAVHIIVSLRWEPEMRTEPADDETTDSRDARIEKYLKTKLNSMKDREIINMVKESIISDGIENPDYTVSDEGYSKAADFLTDYLVKRYPGFANS